MLRATPELALKYLEVAIECDNLDQFVSGMGFYALASNGMDGSEEYMTCYVADALYKKHQKGDIETFEEMVFNAFSKNLANRYDKALNYTLEVFKHMLLSEENGIATFKLDRKSLFAIIKNNVLQNIKFFTYASEGKTPFIFYLFSCFVEIHRITGEWIIPEEELQKCI